MDQFSDKKYSLHNQRLKKVYSSSLNLAYFIPNYCRVIKI